MERSVKDLSKYRFECCTEASKIIKLASEKRENADYLDFFIASQKDAEDQIRRAEKFREWIGEYLKTKGVL